MKIVKIERKEANVRRVNGGYVIDSVQVVPETGIKHKIEYHPDFPDI